MAFAEGKELTTEHLEKAIPEIIPLSQSESNRIEEIREWCKKHAKSANPTKKNLPPKPSGRKVTLS